MPPRNQSFAVTEDDAFEDDEADDETDDDAGDGSDDAESHELATEEDESEDEDERVPRARARARGRAAARGSGGMGRPSTGPLPRADTLPRAASMNAAEATEAPETELAPDISAWPGTSEAAKLAGRHTSTIKLWRTQGRVRAIQDQSGCWRYNPDDLAESVDVPDATDPGAVLASGMSAIVQQGANANERLLRMTEIATDGLKDAASVLSTELERAYAKIAELETALESLREKVLATHSEDLKHERFVLRMTQKHELEVTGAKESSKRLEGLLEIVGPIAASIGARLLGNVMGAETLEARAAGAPVASGFGPQASGQKQPEGDSVPPEARSPKPEAPSPPVPLETRIMDAMARLSAAIRNLDSPALAGLRAMMPPLVQNALDAIVKGESDSAVGKALATLVQAAQNLSDLQFKMLRPIAPADIAAILGELRDMLRSDDPPAPEPRAPS